MTIEQRIDELIELGRVVVESDSNTIAFQNWRFKALGCLSTRFGPDHVYTKYFEHFVRQGDTKNVLAASGVLVAVKEQIKGMQLRRSKSLDYLKLREIQ